MGIKKNMSKPLLILFGTFSGNSESCAEKAAHAARQRGYDPVLENMMDSTADVLMQFDTALLITSTYGDGDPPDGTENFYEEVVNLPRLRLDHLRYAVLALGDSCYDRFCQCGKDYDEALEAQGATRLHSRVDCDIDYDEPCEAWIESVFAILAEERLLAA
jgi:sulfite reductase alpha subunit-like flavoprotein